MRSGDQSGAGSAGAFEISGGAGTSGNGGSVTLEAGYGGGTGADVVLVAGSSSTTDGSIIFKDGQSSRENVLVVDADSGLTASSNSGTSGFELTTTTSGVTITAEQGINIDSSGGVIELKPEESSAFEVGNAGLTIHYTDQTEAVDVEGGMGVAGDWHNGQTVRVLDTTETSSSTTGSFVTAGGFSAAKKGYLGDHLRVESGGIVIDSASADDGGDSEIDQSRLVVENGAEVNDNDVSYTSGDSCASGAELCWEGTQQLSWSTAGGSTATQQGMRATSGLRVSNVEGTSRGDDLKV